MILAHLIITCLLAAAARAVILPLSSRQSSSICGTAPEFIVGDKIEILAWSDLTTSYGYLSASPANVPFWGQSTGYGVTADPTEALTGIFTCGNQGFANWPPALLGAAIEILAWSDLTTSYGYLSASPANVPFWGQSTGYGVTADPTEALTGIFTCGNQGFANWPPALLGAASVPGTTINAIGLIDPLYASGGNPTVNVRGSANWIALGATFVGVALSTPDNTGITYDGSPAAYESVVWTLDHLPAADGTRVNLLTPVWTNPNNSNGGNIDVVLFLSPSLGVVVAISDPAAFESVYASSGPWLQVALVLID